MDFGERKTTEVKCHLHYIISRVVVQSLGHLFCFLVLVLEGLVGLHRTVQLFQHYWLGHRLGLP